MFRLACLAAALLAAVSLGGCASIADYAISPARAEERPPRPAAQPAPQPKPAARAAPAGANGDHAALPRAAVAAEPRVGEGAGAMTEISGAIGRGVEPAGERGFGTAPEAVRSARTARRPASASARLEPVSRMLAAGPAPEGAATGAAALGADQERMRQRDEYINGLKKGAYTFNPPSPIKVAQPVTVALWVDPATEAAQLAEEMKKAFPESAGRVESGATTWSPRMRATLTGVDFAITPVEGEDFDGTKELSLAARTEWAWTIVPTSPGKKKLHLLLSVVLPTELGKPRELPQINRDIEVEVTMWWVIDTFWEKYWKWILGGLGGAASTAIAYWWTNRRRRAK